MSLRLRMGAVVALASATLWGLASVGSGPIGAPPIGSWDQAVAWYERVDAAHAVMAVVRLLAMACAGWLLVGAALQLVASPSLGYRSRRLADALSPRVLRRLAHGAVQLSVTAGLALPSVTSAGAAPTDDPPGIAVMEVVGDPGAPVPDTPPVAPAPVETQPPPAADEVIVQPGNSFWSLAVETVAEANGAPPTDDQVDDYWRRLIEANRDRLIAPGDPDLLRPGQILVLPAL